MPESASPASESSKAVPVGEPPTPEGWPKTIWICEKCGEQPGGVNLPCACTGWDGKRVEVRVAPVGEPDEQKTINGLLDAVERLNGQKDALRRENGQLRELLDLPIGERVEAVAELVGEPDDERLVEKVAELMRRQEGEHRGVQWNLPVYRKRARAVVVAVRGAGRENSE